MRMNYLDWLALVLPLIMVLTVALFSRKYLKSVADYMAGGRCAGRYMLCVARGEMASGAVVFVSLFEIFGKSGFTLTWWQWISAPIILVVATSGFVVYRFRETRALTLAQFFEMRYNKSLRVFAGLLGFFAGIMNFGIIPAVGARFFVYFIGLPEQIFIGNLTIPTFIVVMILLMGVTVYLTVAGGQITVMLSDCLSGLMDQWLFLVIVFALIGMFSWSQVDAVLLGQPPGRSLMNPFDAMGLEDFNLWFVLMGIVVFIYGTMAWQNASAYNSAALTPHESRMGNVLGRWREFSRLLAITVLALAGITYLQHPDFSSGALAVQGVLDEIGNPRLQEQLRIPVSLSHLLPTGIKGLLCAVLITGVWGGDTTHIHSWGGIFVQDVLLPLRRRPFTPKQHIFVLRMSMIGVAVFAVLFGAFFTQTEYITMWFKITTSIFVGGAGSVIIGGLYWKKGTTSGAWAAMLTGSVLSVGGIVVRQIDPSFPMNPMQITFFATVLAIIMYVVVSLLTFRKDFDMDRMLNRGRHAVKEDQVKANPDLKKAKLTWARLVGIDDKFSLSDRWVAGIIIMWSLFWAAVMFIGTIWNLIHRWPDSVWSAFWLWAGILLPLGIGIFTAFWFTFGVTRDLKVFFRTLRNERVDVHDDGSVGKRGNL